MKFVKQFFIIIFISLLGEILHYFLPLPIPASIYGLVLMFLALKFKICPLDAVKETSKYILSIMPIFFVAPAIAILSNLEVLKTHWLFFLLVSFFSTILTMIVAGWSTQLIIRLTKKKDSNENKDGE